MKFVEIHGASQTSASLVFLVGFARLCTWFAIQVLPPVGKETPTDGTAEEAFYGLALLPPSAGIPSHHRSSELVSLASTLISQ